CTNHTHKQPTPSLHDALPIFTIRALREGYRVVGIRRGWAGLVDYKREASADNSECVQELTEAEVNRAGRTGGTFLHTSRTRPSQDRKSTRLNSNHVASSYAVF